MTAGLLKRVLEQMAQQQAVYNQTCRLMVSHRFSVLEGYLTQTFLLGRRLDFMSLFCAD